MESKEPAPSHVLSFVILGYQRPDYGPIHVGLAELTIEAVSAAVAEAVTPILSRKESDPTCWYFHNHMHHNDSRRDHPKDYDQDLITRALLDKGFFRWNYYQKWYVIAFAIDYTRFEVFSRNHEKGLIKWRVDDEADAVAVAGAISYEEQTRLIAECDKKINDCIRSWIHPPRKVKNR